MTTPYCKIISGIGNRDAARVARLATLYAWAGADWLDVTLDPLVVSNACDAIQGAVDAASRPRVMVSLGVAGDPHVGTALLDSAVCATCSSCVIPELRTCAERSLPVRAPECPACQACIGACPYGAITTAAPWSGELDTLLACLANGAQGVELHASGARPEEAAARLGAIAARLPAHVWLSLSVGAEVQRIEDVVAMVRHARGLERANWMVQVEGQPMSRAARDGHSEDASIALVRAVLDAVPDAPVQIAGGTGLHTGRRCRELGLPICGIGFGTAARLAVAGALDAADLARDRPEVITALTAARALVASTRPAVAS